MDRRGILILAGVGLSLVCPGLAFAKAPPRGSGCFKTAVVTSTNSWTQTTEEITPDAARVCSVDFIASGANGWAEVFDSPDTTDPTHGQAKRVAEPGVATAGESASAFFGDLGRPVYHGLGVRVYRGRVTVHYSD